MSAHRVRKRFGQHFLHDRNIINRIIAAINPKPDQTVIEIGPGKGALTIPLLEQLDALHVIELDRDLAKALVKVVGIENKIIIHCLDALNYDFEKMGSRDLYIIGNLPYNISTPLIFHLLKYQAYLHEMVFMLQEEVIDRICAIPGNKNYGRLSVMVQAHCQTEKLFTVSPEAFSPPPKVMSAIIKLKPYNKRINQIANLSDFAYIVKMAFSQRRKTLKNCLKDILNEEQIVALNIAPEARAETLPINNFIQLANSYHEENQ